MKITAMIAALQKELERHGDLEVTCTAALIPDQNEKRGLADVFESTAETLKVTNSNGFGKHLRILWQR